jgi:hypothetical protein
VKLNIGLLWQQLHLTRRGLFYWQNGLVTDEETSKILHLEYSLKSLIPNAKKYAQQLWR